MKRANFDPEYERIVRALRTVATLMQGSEKDKKKLEPIFMRLQHEKDNFGKPATKLDDLIERAMLG